jgi:branched-chain amino acid transport system substrate-binding protein
MHRTRTARSFLLLLLALALVAASCGNRSSDSNSSGGGGGGTGGSGGSGGTSSIDTSNCPENSATDGISGDTITLASSFPQSGLTAAFSQISKGYKAFFDKQNAAGGVKVAGKSYKIKVVDKDDEYTAAKTVQNINELTGTDGSKAFAVFNVVGTANNVAIRESLGSNCVPNVFAATGSPVWGNPDYPWTIGSTLAPYTVEAKAFADYLKDKKPSAKVAMLVQNDDFGKAYEEGFKNAIKGTKITVTQVKSYEAGTSEVASQVTSLKASGADTFFNGATLLACPAALEAGKSQGWNTTTFVSGTCISKTLMGIAGKNADKVFAVTNIKDPQNPAFKDDAAMKEYFSTLDKYAAKDVEGENGIVAYGYTQAAVFVKVLEGLKELTRPALMDAMHNIDGISKVGLLIDGVEVKTSPDDPYLAENVQMIQYDATAAHFNNVGTDVLDFEGKTASLTPKNLINS